MVAVTNLTAEGRIEPLGVEVASPRLAWHIESDEQGTVAQGFEVAVHRGDEIVWSTTGDGFHVDYAGPALEPATRYAWSVRVRTSHGDAEASSSFETGLPEAAWWASRWIGATPTDTAEDESGSGTSGAQAAPLLRTEFDASIVTAARLYLAAGGIAVARLNGVAVSDEVLGPGLSDWDDRVQYSVTDVTALIREGANAVTLELGRGFYGITTENVWDWQRAPWHAEPSARALLRLTNADGTVTELGTSADWRMAEGPTRFDSFYEGTVWDARAARPGADLAGYDDSGWDGAREVTGPRGRLDARRQPPIRIVETLAPASIERRPGPDGEVGWRVRFPRQVAGWVRVRIPAASTVTLRYAETIGDDGEPVVDDFFSQGRFQSDVVRADGPIEWEPQFCYFGFQVVDVDGWPGELTVDAIEARVLHSDVARVGGFEASDPVLGRMHEAAIQTVLNNLHHVPTDTPVYEKNGWTGDAVLAADLMLRSLDVAPLLDQWLDHIADSTDADGRPALIAPDPDWVWPGYEESPPWNAIVVLLPWSLYQATGDERMLQRHFTAALRYLRLEHTTAAGHLSQSGLGDYIPPDANGNPPEDLAVAGTAHVYLATRVLAQWARVIGRPEDAELDAAADAIRDAFNAQWLTADGGYADAIGGARQAHQVLALAFGLAPPDAEGRVLDALVADIAARDDHLWVGSLAAKHLLRELTRRGHAPLAQRIALRPDAPSWGAWFAQGATTMWESWHGVRSRNHYFFGTIDDWLFGDLAGLERLEPGGTRWRIDPMVLPGIDWTRAWVATAVGRLTVERNRDVLSVDVPVGCVVEVHGAEFGAGRHTVPLR